jgi:predicted house-cleaning noncanonical NTP pyrophosphatase (MazG superfamily)
MLRNAERDTVKSQSFNKLVRDKIPGIIEKSGRRAITRTLSDDEYVVELKRKLIEETHEFAESGTIEELADILEVVHALASCVSGDPQALEEARTTKCRERGGFERKVFLIEAQVPGSS